jgi:hypothetical protein
VTQNGKSKQNISLPILLRMPSHCSTCACAKQFFLRVPGYSYKNFQGSGSEPFFVQRTSKVMILPTQRLFFTLFLVDDTLKGFKKFGLTLI